MVGQLSRWMGHAPRTAYARHKPLVLINGLAEQSESWFRNVPHWQRSFTVHAPGLMVYDGEALHRRIDTGEPISVDYLVDQLHDYLSQHVQSGPYHLVASSLGGKIAVEFAVRYPSLVNRLVLICPSGMGDAENLPIVEGVRRNDMASLIHSVFHNPRTADPGLIDFYQSKFPNRRWRTGLLRTIRGTMNHVVRHKLAGVQAKTLLIAGEQDKITDPREAARAAADLPNGQFLLIPQCGHAPQIEKATLVNRVVTRFLSKQT